MAQETIDKIINIQLKYTELIDGWEKTSEAIASANEELKKFKQQGDSQGVAKQTILLKALRSELAQYNREIQSNIKEELKQEGSIEQLRASISKLTAQYNKLSREERNATKGNALGNKIREIQTELNEANTSLLNFRDNVGNYASAAKGFTPLSFQVQQLAREVPSLTVSLQQFFLAISNNAPMLADEFTRARKANKALRAEGKATVPVFRQLISSIFSWQTALVVGITLLTAFGKEIGNWVKELFKGKEAAISMAEAQQNVNKALAEDGYGIGDLITKYKELQLQWTSLSSDLDSKKRFIIENKDAFNDLGVKVDDVNEAENLLVDRTESFITSLKLRAQAAAGQKLAAEAYEKALIEQQKVEDEIAKGSEYKEYKYANELGATYIVKVRPYTEAEKEELMAPVKALEAQGDAYMELSAKKEADAKATMEAANIQAKTNKDQQADIETAAERSDRWINGFYAKMIKQLDAARDKQQQSAYISVEEAKKWAQDALKDMDKEWVNSVKGHLAQKQEEYRNRLLRAQTEGGETGAQNEIIRIAQEQISIYRDQLNEIDLFRTAYEEMGYSAVEIDNKRLEALKALQDAEQTLQDVQNKEVEDKIKAGEKQAQLSFQSAQQVAGALGELAEAAGASAGITGMLAIAQSAAAMGAALHKAFSTSATVWDGIAGAVAAIATITTVVSTIRGLNSSAEEERGKYRFAQGGLVTGPGTGTSDSIPARLSNGEAVMTARAVSDWGAVLSAINVSSGGRAINVSNLPERGDGMRGMRRMMEQVMFEMPNPIVLVKDINTGQRRVQVSENLGRLGGKRNKK